MIECCVRILLKCDLCSFTCFSGFGNYIVCSLVATHCHNSIHVCTSKIIFTVTALSGQSCCLYFRIEYIKVNFYKPNDNILRTKSAFNFFFNVMFIC